MIAILAVTTGVAAAHDWDDDYRFDNRYSDYGYGYGYGNFRLLSRVARDYGFRDGARVGQEDTWRGKPYNPYPRGKYDDADHGYSRRFGDKHVYRQIYTEAYRRGYESAFRGYSYGYRGYWR